MTIDTIWRLNADIQPEMTVEGGVFKNVITTIHWRCIATDKDSGQTLDLYGSVLIPPPSSAENYIDLTILGEMSVEKRRATVLSWAEAIKPGFVAETEAQAIAALEAQLSAPAVVQATIM